MYRIVQTMEGMCVYMWVCGGEPLPTLLTVISIKVEMPITKKLSQARRQKAEQNKTKQTEALL